MRRETEWLEIVALTPRQLKLWVEDMPALTFAFHERNKRDGLAIQKDLPELSV